MERAPHAAPVLAIVVRYQMMPGAATAAQPHPRAEGVPRLASWQRQSVTRPKGGPQLVPGCLHRERMCW